MTYYLRLLTTVLTPPRWCALFREKLCGCVVLLTVSLFCFVPSLLRAWWVSMSVSLVVLITSFYKVCTGWLARVMYGGPLHKAAARLLYLPSLARMSILWSRWKRNWYDRVDDTVVLGALPFRSQTKEVLISILPVSHTRTWYVHHWVPSVYTWFRYVSAAIV